MAKVLKTTFQLRRGYETAWEKNNPVLAQGEPGFVIDKNAFKIGDGATAWNDLEYISSGSWNDLKDKPFDETVINIYDLTAFSEEEFDSLEMVEIDGRDFRKISDNVNGINLSDGFNCNVLTFDNEVVLIPNLQNGDDFEIMAVERGTMNIKREGSAEVVNITVFGTDGIRHMTKEIYISLKENAEFNGVQIPKGIYTTSSIEGYCSIISLASVFIKTIDSKYIPDTVVKVQDLNNTTSFIKTEKQVLTPLQKLNGLNNLGILNAGASPIGYYDLTFDNEGKCYTDEFAEYVKSYQQVGYRLWYHKDYKNHEYIGVYTHESDETHFEDFIDFGRFRIYSNCILDTEADYDEWSVTFELESFKKIIDQEYININNNFEIFMHYNEETNIDFADRSYDEIIEAYEAGKHLIVTTDNGYTFAPIATIDPNMEYIDLMSTFFSYIIHSDNTVEYIEYQFPTYDDIPVHTWESLPDKPFGGEIYTVTNETDYFVPIEGRPDIGKISSMVVPRECLVGMEVCLNGQKDILTQEVVDLWVENGMITDDFALIGDFILMIYTAEVVIQGLTFPEIGTYSVPAEFVKLSITWEGIKTLDPKYLPDISETVDTTVVAALTEAKESGEFDGKTPIKGIDYYTEADKTEIVNLVLSALPTWNGGSY